MWYLVVLDFTMGETYIYPSPHQLSKEEIDDIFENKGHNPNQCQWMCGNKIKFKNL